MRVIAGELGGRRLISPPDESVRPTADRAREALFSILGDLAGLEVLDLFSGTGALAIEALSRGAASATLVDVDVRPAEANVEALGLGDRVRLLRRDALDFLREGDSRYQLVLCDPPYRLAVDFEPDLQNLVPARIADGGTLVIESGARNFRPLEFEGLELKRQRRYGNALMRVWS